MFSTHAMTYRSYLWGGLTKTLHPSVKPNFKPTEPYQYKKQQQKKP